MQWKLKYLMLSMMGKNFSRQHFEMFLFFFFPENRLWPFMQIVSGRQFAWEVKAYFLWRQSAWNAKAYFLGKDRKNIIILLSAEFA